MYLYKAEGFPMEQTWSYLLAYREWQLSTWYCVKCRFEVLVFTIIYHCTLTVICSHYSQAWYCPWLTVARGNEWRETEGTGTWTCESRSSWGSSTVSTKVHHSGLCEPCVSSLWSFWDYRCILYCHSVGTGLDIIIAGWGITQYDVVFPEWSLIEILRHRCVQVAWYRHMRGEGGKQGQIQGVNVPAAELYLFLKTWVCHCMLVHHFYSILALMTYNSIHCTLFHVSWLCNSVVSYLRQCCSTVWVSWEECFHPVNVR